MIMAIMLRDIKITSNRKGPKPLDKELQNGLVDLKFLPKNRWVEIDLKYTIHFG